MQTSLHPRAVELTTDEARAGRDQREWELLSDLEDARLTMEAVLAHDDQVRTRRIRAGFRRTYAAYARRDWELNTCLIHQTEYVFKQPLKLPKGTKMLVTAHYDN